MFKWDFDLNIMIIVYIKTDLYTTNCLNRTINLKVISMYIIFFSCDAFDFFLFSGRYSLKFLLV